MNNNIKSLSELVDHTTSWNWEDEHVSQAYDDKDLNPVGSRKKSVAINDIVESGTVLIAAGPADLDSAISGSGNSDSGIRIVPIGLVESAQINMSKPLSRIFEIGSKLSYIIPGRTVGGISLSRVFFDGPSLLKAIYTGEVLEDSASDIQKSARFASDGKGIDGKIHKSAHIGSGNVAMNLASSFFDQPVGLAFYFRDQNNDEVGNIYFEGCRVNTYNMGLSSQMNVLTESISMEFVRCRPIVTRATVNFDARGLSDRNIVSDEKSEVK